MLKSKGQDGWSVEQMLQEKDLSRRAYKEAGMAIGGSASLMGVCDQDEGC